MHLPLLIVFACARLNVIEAFGVDTAAADERPPRVTSLVVAEAMPARLFNCDSKMNCEYVAFNLYSSQNEFCLATICDSNKKNPFNLTYQWTFE